MMLTEMPKVGDKVRYINDSQVGLTNGRTYLIGSEKDCGSAVFKDNDDNLRYIPTWLFHHFELVTEESLSVTDLIANLGRRLSEIETLLAPKDIEESDGSTVKAAQIRQACDEVRDLLIRKNHDYGDSFAQQYAKYGLQSALIRMDDKMRRLETLTDGKQAQVEESIEDTLADLAGYALLALVEARAAK